MTEEEKQKGEQSEEEKVSDTSDSSVSTAESAAQMDKEETKEKQQNEKSTIAERRVHGFKLNAGKEIEEIPEYTLADADAKKIRAKRRHSAWIRVTMGVLIVAVAALLALGILFGVQDMSGFGKGDQKITIEIPQNAGTEKVAEVLEESGVVRSGMLFRVYYKLTKPEGSFHAGVYTLNSNMSYSTILSELFKYASSQEEVEVQFPEGATIYQMAQKLEEKGVCSAEEFLDTVDVVTIDLSFVSELEENSLEYHPLEGYLFPDTYMFYKNDNPANVIKKMMTTFESKVLTEENRARMEELGLSLEETITLASIIQQEGNSEESMAMVSSVYHNRLNDPENYPRLQADPTRVYGRELRTQMGDEVNEEIITAYDTYQSEGLPPGPICNPGVQAITAALNPESTEYYYFCTNLSTGKFYYAKTLAEHEKNLKLAGLK